MAAGPGEATSKLLGQLRLVLARKEGLLKVDDFRFAWVTGFPLLEWGEEEGRWFSMHHPFTAPVDADVAHLDRDPSLLRAKAYDLVLNGSEIGGGSIRIHDSALQGRIFSLLGIGEEEARQRFGFFLDALQYGTPPHGGIALGLDRIIAHPGRRGLDPGSHRLPEDHQRGRPDGGRAVGSRRAPAARTARPAARLS